MPELPEVETVCRTLSELIVGKTIKEVRVALPRIVRTPEDPQQFCLELQGETIHDVSRRGKFIKISLDRIVLISHLRMEGRYGVYDQHDTIEKHTHVFFTFTDGTELRYKDVRQFGTMDLVKRGKEDKSPPLNKLGIEPLDPSFTLDRFRMTMNKRTTKIKPFLLNQECIVGLGNIYVDEVLFRSGIHPERRVNHLKETELETLHQAIIDTLTEAVSAGGTSVKSYVNGQGEMGMFQQNLKVYGRRDEPCLLCGAIIERFVVSGRGTHVCGVCQPFKEGH